MSPGNMLFKIEHALIFISEPSLSYLALQCTMTVLYPVASAHITLHRTLPPLIIHPHSSSVLPMPSIDTPLKHIERNTKR